MDQKIRTAGGCFVTYVCLCVGIGMAVLGFAMLSDSAKVARLISAMMLISSALLLYGGITNLITTRKGAKRAKDELEQVEKIIQQSSVSTTLSNRTTVVSEVATKSEDKPNILAYWKYTAQEWQQFMGWEKKARKSGHFIEAAVIVVFGVVLLMYNRGAGFMLSLGLSVFIAVIYWLGKYHLSVKSIGVAKNDNEIVITDTAVIINGKYNSFKDEIYWLQKVKINEGMKPEILIIEYGWQTRRGNTFEEIRIPIQQGRLNEAKEVQDRLLSLVNKVRNVSSE